MASSVVSQRGRPKVSVDRQQLIFIRSLRFSWEDISAILGVSASTLRRRARAWQVHTFSSMSDSELDEVITDLLHNFPNAGEALLRGHLQSAAIHVQRSRLRLSVQRIRGTQACPYPPIFRRTYNVPGPNHLWHVDGNHKMIKWCFVVHGGIITYLRCSTNNRADTVGALFVKATEQYGIPSRVRSDYGGENVQIWRFMEEHSRKERTQYTN